MLNETVIFRMKLYSSCISLHFLFFIAYNLINKFESIFLYRNINFDLSILERYPTNILIFYTYM